MDAQLEPFHFTLQEGKITEASLTLQLVRPEEKKTELAPVYERKEKADKSVEIVKTQEVAQQGALREGEGTRWQSLHKQLGPFILEKVCLLYTSRCV